MRRTGIVLAAALAVAPGCSKRLDIDSAWAARPIVVDGRGDDWADVELQHESDGDLSFGVANDGTHVYLLLATQDRPVVRGMQRWGATLWLDPTADRKKQLGLHIRGGPGPDDEPPGAPGGGRYRGGAGDESFHRRQREAQREAAPAFDETQRPPGDPGVLELDVVDAGGDVHPLDPAAAGAPVAAVTRAGDTWTYEVAVPLAADGGLPVALRARPGAKVDLGVELVLPSHEVGSSSPWRGGYGPVGGGRVGGPTGWGVEPYGQPAGGRPGRGPGKPPDPSDVWLVVKLATPPVPRS